MSDIISVEHLAYTYPGVEDTPGVPVFADLNLTIEQGSFVAVLGTNGCGKSTLAKHFNAILLPSGGKVYVCGIDTANEDRLITIRRNVGMVFQNPDNQIVANVVEEDVAFAPQNYGLPEEEVAYRTKMALAAVHIGHLAKKPIHKLSGGEKKLAAIATILSMKPDIILMDEPSAALDPQNRRNLIRVLNEFSYLKLIASHDLDFVWDTCDRTILLSEGRIVCDGDTKEILSDRKLLETHGLELPLSLYRK